MTRTPIKQGGTVTNALEDYRYAILHLSPRTQKEYAGKLTVFAAWCEEQGVGVGDIKQAVIRRFVAHLRERVHEHTGKPISPVTVHGYCRVLKAFLFWLSHEEDYEDLVSDKVASRIEMPHCEQTLIEVFTPEQIKALLLACEKEYNQELTVRDRAIVSVLIDTGVRASELVGLTLENVFLDPHDSYLKVLGKGNKWREVALGRQSVAALRRYITRYRHGGKNEKHVFLNRHGARLTVRGLEEIIKRLGEWGRVKGVRCSPHTCRHTYAVSYLQASGDVYRLSRLLGHTSVKVTEVYLRAVSNRSARQGISVLDAM